MSGILQPAFSVLLVNSFEVTQELAELAGLS